MSLPTVINRKYTKYTKELLAPLVKKNISISGIMRDLGFKYFHGYMHAYISKVIKNFNLDTSHFKGKGSNFGKSHKGGCGKKDWQDVLILHDLTFCKNRTRSNLLRRALLEFGRSYKCVDCGNKGIWRSKPLQLQIDHKNGLHFDNRPENLNFRCHNCHSQTTTFGFKGKIKYSSNVSMEGFEPSKAPILNQQAVPFAINPH